MSSNKGGELRTAARAAGAVAVVAEQPEASATSTASTAAAPATTTSTSNAPPASSRDPATAMLSRTAPTPPAALNTKMKHPGRPAATPGAVAATAKDDGLSSDHKEASITATAESQMASSGNAPKGRDRFQKITTTNAAASASRDAGKQRSSTATAQKPGAVAVGGWAASMTTTASTAGAAAMSKRDAKQRFGSTAAAKPGAVAVSASSGTSTSNAGDIMASKELLANRRNRVNSQHASNAIVTGAAILMTTTEPAPGAVSMTLIEGSTLEDKAKRKDPRRQHHAVRDTIINSATADCSVESTGDMVEDSIKYDEKNAATVPDVTVPMSVPEVTVPGSHRYNGNQRQPSCTPSTFTVETMHTNSTQGVDTTAAIFDDSNLGVLTHANAPPSAQPATVRDAEFVVVDIVKDKGGEKALCSRNRWLVLGVIVAVIAIGGAVGGVLAGGGSDSSNEENSPAPTIALPPPPTPESAAPTISSDEVARWMDVISSASPNTSFLDPAGAASQALEWMKADIFSASLDDPSLVQRFAFVTLWYSTDGANWNVSPNWLDAGGSECDWKGVTCDVNNITAIALIMAENTVLSSNLVGPIPLELGLLTMLEAINFAYNGLTGTIPTELGQLTKMVYFVLWANNLMGTIPTELGLLTATKELYIDENDLEGSIPSEIGQLSLLEEFSATCNQLVGPLLLGGQLSALKIMQLSDNQLSSTLPTELGLLTSMVTLALAQNKFEMGIPSELGQLTKLKKLVLNNANLGLTIPTEIGLLSALDWIDISSNKLTGPIPSEIGMLASLLVLEASSNELAGPVPSEIGMLKKMYTLQITFNQLTGSIPEMLCPPAPGKLTTAAIDCAEVECACCQSYLASACPVG